MAWFGRSDRNTADSKAQAAQSQRALMAGGEAPARPGRIRSLLQAVILTPEQRALTSLPWNVGGPLAPPLTPTIDLSVTLAAVYASVRILATNIASLPLHAYRTTTDGTIRVKSLPALFDQPSVHGTLWDWLHRLVSSLALAGNAYGLVTRRDGFGYPTGVEWLHPDDVSVQDLAWNGPGSFIDPIFRWRGRVIPKENLVHIPWFTVPWRVKGLSPIGAYAASVNAGLGAMAYSQDWFNAGGVPPGTFQNSAKQVNQQEADQIKERLVNAIRSHKPIVYGNDWEYKPIAINPHEAQFIETMKMTATQIAVVYGVPPEKVGGEKGGSMTYANSEQESIDLVQFTLLPWVKKLESAFFPIIPQAQYVKFNLDAMIRVDVRTRHDVHFIDRRMGLKSINEIRELEDLPPITGKEADEANSHSPLVSGASDMGKPPVGNPLDAQPAPNGKAGVMGNGQGKSRASV